jgi:hypothetical protein
MWDRFDDAFDDERYGTPGELQAEVETLQRKLRSQGCPQEVIDAAAPDLPNGPSAAGAHHRLTRHTSRLKALLRTCGGRSARK